MAVGLLLLASLDGVNPTVSGFGRGPLFRHQVAALLPGLALALGLALLDYRRLRPLHGPLYALGLLGVLVVLREGLSAKGARRWLQLGLLGSVQPSEPVKLCVVLTLAALLARVFPTAVVPERPLARRAVSLGWPRPASRSRSGVGWAVLIPALLVPLLPSLAILKQPDLGTALVIWAVALPMLFLAGASPWRLAMVVLPAVAWLAQHLRGYQRERLLVFLDPERDPTGAGWNLIQARLAVGGGHLWGQGLFAGAQKQLQYVPEQHTDFIFTVVGEELGWLGCTALLLIFALVVVRGLRIARRAADPFGALLAGGIVMLLAVHVLANVGMVTGLLPVVGVPLPLFSSGGSNLWTTLASLGILQSIAAHRRVLPARPPGLVAEPGLLADPDQRQVLPLPG